MSESGNGTIQWGRVTITGSGVPNPNQYNYFQTIETAQCLTCGESIDRPHQVCSGCQKLFKFLKTKMGEIMVKELREQIDKLP